MNGDSALVLFSGGQDSTTCLAWALARFVQIETVGFDYGQRHAAELVARKRILSRLNSDFSQWQTAIGRAINLGMDGQFIIHTPLMHIDKQQTWALAESLGGKRFVDLIIEETVTGYEGNRETRHEWGYGCGECPACQLRATGYGRYASQ